MKSDLPAHERPAKGLHLVHLSTSESPANMLLRVYSWEAAAFSSFGRIFKKKNKDVPEMCEVLGKLSVGFAKNLFEPFEAVDSAGQPGLNCTEYSESYWVNPSQGSSARASDGKYKARRSAESVDEHLQCS